MAAVEETRSETVPQPLNAGEPIALEIGGMTCAACSARVERVLSRVEGVKAASVNLALERAEVVPGAEVETADLIKVVEKAGFSARPARAQGG